MASTIDEMRLEDVGAVAALCAQVLTETWRNPTTLAAVIEANGSEAAWTRYLDTRRCFIARRGDEAVGAAWVLVADRTAYVGGAFVRYRGEGIGGELLAARLAYAVEQGCTSAHASVVVGNLASRRNLERHRFELATETDAEWIFTKRL